MAFSIIVTVLAFGIMVMLHEAGHFITAKKFGVTVHEFSIGMGPLIFKWGKGETQYSVRLLPLGGYVKLEGEGEESDDPKAFSNISPLKRIVILAAGAVMNVALGFLCFVIINNVNPYAYSTTIDTVVENSAAYEAGLQAGDRIVRLDNTRVYTKSDVDLFMMDEHETIRLTYLRGDEKATVELTPRKSEDGRVIIGFVPEIEELSFFESMEYAYYDTRYVVKAVIYSLKELFTGGAKVSDLSGPVGVVQVVDQTAEQVREEYGPVMLLMVLLNLFGMISVNLGVFNLLPFPALDGGSIIFALIELVTRKKQNPNIIGYINFVGLALILGLGIFVMFSDIGKLF